ncbi:hypothetical protein H0H93_013607 [Arthromyces matolae]|nr:hypothetical protein H0H93_013607 [Arthromyces matolae]
MYKDKQLQDLYAVIAGLEQEVTRLKGDKSGSLTVKNALSNARRQFTRNTNKAEKLEKSMKIAAANEALTLPASQALKRGRTEANTGEPQAKRKVRYVEIDGSLSHSSSLSPPPDDFPADGGAEEQQKNVKEHGQPSVSEAGNDTVSGGRNSEEPSAGDAKDVELPGGETIDQGGIGDGEGVKLRGDEKGEQAVNGERAQSKWTNGSEMTEVTYLYVVAGNAQEGPNPSSEGDDGRGPSNTGPNLSPEPNDGRGPSDTRPDPTPEADDGRGPSDTIIATTAETPDITVANNNPEDVLPVVKPVNLYKGKSKRRKGTTEDISILSKSYAQLDEDDKEEFCRAGRVVFRAFLMLSEKEQENFEFPASLGAAVRGHVEVLRESAYLTRNLAVAMLTSTSKNRQCIHHMMNRKQSKEAEAFEITGVYAKRALGTKKDHDKTAQPSIIFECGCREDSALWDFLIWKVFTVSEAVGGGIGGEMKSELFGPMTMDPRRRIALTDAVQHWSGLMIKDMYTGPGNLECALDAEFPYFWGAEHQLYLCQRSMEGLKWKENYLLERLMEEAKQKAKEAEMEISDWRVALTEAGVINGSSSSTKM